MGEDSIPIQGTRGRPDQPHQKSGLVERVVGLVLRWEENCFPTRTRWKPRNLCNKRRRQRADPPDQQPGQWRGAFLVAAL